MMLKDRKNIILIVLMVAVLLMSYGYSGLLKQLNIQGSAEINNANWQVEITNIVDKSVLGSAKVLQTPTFTPTTGTLNTGFSYKGDSVVYEVTVSNSGGLDAKLEHIDVILDDTKNNAVTYKITNVTPGSTILRSGETNKINVAVTYSNPENQSTLEFTENAKVIVNYVQSQI